ncbi:MAG: ATP-grasp domain-containing protein [Gemmatimonadota bacterium]
MTAFRTNGGPPAPRVFVTDGAQRKAIPCVRSLGRHGVNVVVGDTSRLGAAMFSKYCAGRVIYPSPSGNPSLFAEWLDEHLRSNRYDAFLAIDEATLEPVARHRDALAEHTAILVPDHARFMKARDKAQTLRLAQEVGILHPRTSFITCLDELQGIVKEIDLPVVIKPRRSQGSRGIAYVHERSDLVPRYLGIHAEYPFPLIQEFIPPGGDAVGVGVLFNRRSELRATFAYRRLREFPVSGGPSTLREGIHAPELVSMAVRLLEAIGWIGVAHVEFKFDPRDDTPKLMEVNPKIWGSIELPIVSGIDFPYLMYRLAVEADIELAPSYRPGVRCRWLLPGDFLHLLTSPKHFRMQPSFFQFVARDLHYDVLSLSDPGPIFGTILWYARKLPTKKLWSDFCR